MKQQLFNNFGLNPEDIQKDIYSVNDDGSPFTIKYIHIPTGVCVYGFDDTTIVNILSKLAEEIFVHSMIYTESYRHKV